MQCLVCGSARVESIGKVGSKTFSITSDTKICAMSANVHFCPNCGHLQKFHTPDEKIYIEGLYKSYEPHYLSGGSEPLVFTSDGPPVPRSFFVLEKFLPVIKKGPGKFLDIGTGNGNVIKSAQRLLAGWSLNAFDVTDIYKDEILKVPSVENFYSGSINTISGEKFDVITMWHSLEHIEDPAGTLNHIKKLLRDDGILIIQVPDIMRNPYDLSVIDHCSHFSKGSLERLLISAGLDIRLDARDLIYNCLTLAAGIKDNIPRKRNVPADKNTGRQLFYLNEIINYFTMETGSKNYYIFGSGGASACIYSQMPRKPLFFIDEDDNKMGKKLDGVEIISAGAAKENSIVLLPFFKDMAVKIIENIKNGVSKKFNFRFVDF